ncbi:LysE family translocator [uncultured Sutterella sp.]|uniref:LysE family translocator n=1 Tax=uncultured Sutterella sp. TaxID=286133 RepID=UPI00262C1AD8|nr:LysE family translocator [uncultured Sutterella sp.]
MINWNDYLLFIPAVVVITLLPGPDFAITVRTTLVHGRRAGILCLLGVNLGVAVHTTAAILGISALIMGSEELFNILKWAGAVYLFWLGIGAIRESFQKKPEVPNAAEKMAAVEESRKNGLAAFRSGLFCNLLNPKVVVFVLTFFPQFIDPKLPAAPQLALLGLTWSVLGILWLTTLVLLMEKIRPVFERPSFRRWLNRTTGAVLILFGIKLAFERN